MQDTAIVLTTFGTSTSAAVTYDSIDKDVKQSFPGFEVVWSFTSQRLRAVMRQKGKPWMGPEEALLELAKKGCKKAVLQSLHIVPGFEYEKMASACQKAPIETGLGRPLLGSEQDCKKVIDALEQYIKQQDGSTVVLVGHGTSHARGISMYALFQTCLYERFPDNVYLCMIEGKPSWDEIYKSIRKSKTRQVVFLPFMLVAGVHMMEDVLGNVPGAWVSDLKGYFIRTIGEGLGCNQGIRNIYKEHIRCALAEIR